MISNSTLEARAGLENILTYLDNEFGFNYGKKYLEDYWHIRTVLESLPLGFPMASEDKGIRKLVFRKRTTMYYRIIDVIEILAIIDNRRDFNPNKIELP